MRVALLLLVGACAEHQSEPSTLFISDYRASSIFRYDGVTGEYIDTIEEVDRPAGMRLGPHDQLYAAGFGRGEVVRYDVHSGRRMDVFYWDTALLEEPVELLFHDNELIVLGNDTANIVVVGMDGALVRTFGYPLIRQAHDFVIDARGRALVATDPVIQIWDVASGMQLGEAGRGHLVLATSITANDDAIFVADWDLDQILEFSPDGHYRRVLIDDVRDPISIDLHDGALVVLDARGIHTYDAQTGARRTALVPRDDRLLYPRSFTFVR